MKAKFGNVRYICPFICLPGLLEMPEQQVCQKTEKFRINVVIKLKDLSVWSMDEMDDGCMESWIISSYLFAKFIHLRKVSDSGASQGGGVLHQHDLAPVLVHLDHLPVQPLGRQVVEGSHGNGTIFVSEIHFNGTVVNVCTLCSVHSQHTCGGWWWAGQSRYRVNIEWSTGAKQQIRKIQKIIDPIKLQHLKT